MEVGEGPAASSKLIQQGDNLRFSNAFALIGLAGAARYLLRMSIYCPDIVAPEQAQSDVELLVAKLSKCESTARRLLRPNPSFKYDRLLHKEILRARRKARERQVRPRTGSACLAGSTDDHDAVDFFDFELFAHGVLSSSLDEVSGVPTPR